MDWYEKAASSFIDYFEGDLTDLENTVNDLYEEKCTGFRFHFSGGMWFRNALRQLGYTDNKYGNLDDHYETILDKVFKKVINK